MTNIFKQTGLVRHKAKVCFCQDGRMVKAVIPGVNQKTDADEEAIAGFGKNHLAARRDLVYSKPAKNR